MLVFKNENYNDEYEDDDDDNDDNYDDDDDDNNDNDDDDDDCCRWRVNGSSIRPLRHDDGDEEDRIFDDHYVELGPLLPYYLLPYYLKPIVLDGESTAPPSDRSDRSSGHMTSDRSA